MRLKKIKWGDSSKSLTETNYYKCVGLKKGQSLDCPFYHTFLFSHQAVSKVATGTTRQQPMPLMEMEINSALKD